MIGLVSRSSPRGPLLPLLAALLALAVACLPAAADEAESDRPLLVTVDDLPLARSDLHPDPAGRRQITRQLLEALKKHRIRAVGLVTWNNVRGPEDLELLEMWLDAGHELGNHTTEHLDYNRTDIETFIEDAERAREKLARFLEARGEELRFFRFPMLHEGDSRDKLQAMRDYLAESGQRNLPVTLDTTDWSFEQPWVDATEEGDPGDARRVGEDYLAALRLSVRHHERTGDALFGRRLPQILLLHANAVGAANWNRLFGWLADEGHRFTDADRVLADPVFDEAPAFVGRPGYGLWERWAAERQAEAARTQVTELLERQAAAWTAGDLDAFCSVYADEAKFVSPDGMTVGRQQILERYRRRYVDRSAMGSLTLEVQEVDVAQGTERSMLGDSRPGRPQGASVIARWTLSYPDREAATGMTLLTFRRQSEGWVIIHDASM